MKTMKPTFIMGMLAICMGMMSCQDDEDTNISTIKPGTYSANIIVNSESGSTNYSRGIDVEKGIFTSTYEQNNIYLHRVNAEGNGEEALYIPMRTDCGEDKCFNIQVTKNENGDNISYTIITEDDITEENKVVINDTFNRDNYVKDNFNNFVEMKRGIVKTKKNYMRKK